MLTIYLCGAALTFVTATAFFEHPPGGAALIAAGWPVFWPVVAACHTVAVLHAVVTRGKL